MLTFDLGGLPPFAVPRRSTYCRECDLSAQVGSARGAKWVKVMANEPRPWVRLRRVVE